MSSSQDSADIDENEHGSVATPMGSGDGSRLRSVIRTVCLYGGTATLALLVAAIALRLWNAHLGIPFVYVGDSLPHGMHFEQLDSNLWYFSEPRLGAPFGQQFQDWPLPDLLHLLLAKFFTIFTSNYAVVLNAMFLVGFPLAAVTALWVTRQFKISAPIAVVISVLYANFPYHYVRGEEHLFLGLYYSVPLGIWIAYQLATGQKLFAGRSWITVRTVLFCVAVAWTGVYYAVFALILICTALVARQIRQWRAPIFEGLVVIALILGLVVVATAPSMVYSFEHGDNSLASQRQPHEADEYGLKVARMLMPVPHHAIPALNKFENDYYSTFPLAGEGGSAALGVVASVGLLYLLGLLLVGVVRRNAFDTSKPDGLLSVFTAVLIFVGSIGGASTFIGLLVTAQIRAWNRVSIFIGFMALIATALLLERFAKRIGRRHGALALACVVFVVGFGDQALAKWTPNYAQTDAAFLNDQKFFRQIEATMPEGAMIYQLPWLQFPEGPQVVKAHPYDHIKGYLHTKDVEWSFGAIKGRIGSEWQARLAPPEDTEKFLDEIIDAGFTGLYIDRAGYADNGVAIEDNIRRITGVQGLVHQDERQVFYDLRSYANKTGVDQSERNDLLFDVYPQPSAQFYPIERVGDESWWWASHNDVTFGIANTGNNPSTARIDFGLGSGDDDTRTFNIIWPDGSRQTVRAGSEPVRVEKTIQLLPGTHDLTIDSDAKRINVKEDNRDLFFRMYDVDVSPG